MPIFERVREFLDEKGILSEDMAIREWLNENQIIVAGLVAIVLVLSLARIGCSLTGSGPYYGPTITELYYYDLNTGELFAGPIGQLPPIKAPSDGPDALSGVRAVVFSCDGCRDDLRIGYLERASEEARQHWEQITSGVDEEDHMMYMPDFMENKEVRSVESDEWFSMYSNEGNELVFNAYQIQCPDGSTARECHPQSK